MNKDYLETIKNEYPDKITKLNISTHEFTCLCPGKRNQPDFATLIIEYVPDKYLIELKSLKLYFYSYRNEEIYHETATNKILEDLVEKYNPKWMKITGRFNVRGGIYTDVVVEYGELKKDKIPEEYDVNVSEINFVKSRR